MQPTKQTADSSFWTQARCSQESLSLKPSLKILLRRAAHQLSLLFRNHVAREKKRNPDVTEREWEIYNTVKAGPLTMLSLERILANIRAVGYVVSNRIPGDIVECGVWRGGSSMAMAMALLEYSDTSRTLWMYDTYAGMTEATDVDMTHWGANAADLLAAAKQHEAPEHSLVLARASLEDVTANMQSTGYPVGRINFVKGPVEQTIPGVMPDQIALLRIDTDWYESTRHELRHLYPRLSPGGILIIDDYGHWQGARKAVDEYFKDAPLFLHRIDYTGRLAVKPTGHRLRTADVSDAVAEQSLHS